MRERIRGSRFNLRIIRMRREQSIEPRFELAISGERAGGVAEIGETFHALGVSEFCLQLYHFHVVGDVRGSGSGERFHDRNGV